MTFGPLAAPRTTLSARCQALRSTCPAAVRPPRAPPPRAAPRGRRGVRAPRPAPRRGTGRARGTRHRVDSLEACNSGICPHEDQAGRREEAGEEAERGGGGCDHHSPRRAVRQAALRTQAGRASARRRAVRRPNPGASPRDLRDASFAFLAPVSPANQTASSMPPAISRAPLRRPGAAGAVILAFIVPGCLGLVPVRPPAPHAARRGARAPVRCAARRGALPEACSPSPARRRAPPRRPC
jgi:hypothetical protein